MLTTRFIPLLFIVMISLFSCKREEELSAREKVIGVWVVEEWFVNDQRQSDEDVKDFRLEINDDGTGYMTSTFGFREIGIWRLEQENGVLVFETLSEITRFRIVLLSETRLHILIELSDDKMGLTTILIKLKKEYS
jgi:hypothetical protein